MIKILFFILVIQLFGCASATIDVRPDFAKSPLDTNYKTVLMRSTCGPGISMGQLGCSVDEFENLSNHSLSVLTPLGGIVSIVSKECGYEHRTFLEEGGVVTVYLSDMIPPMAKFRTFDIFTRWDKPPKVKTELPFRGQMGQFYVRIRPPETTTSELEWTPPQGTIKSNDGILFAQFRQDQTSGEDDREPILLRVTTSKEAVKGMFQLYSEAKQIGIKSAPFSGRQILVPRDKILDSSKVGDYRLAGWAVTNVLSLAPLNDDFVVALNVFSDETIKLAGRIEFENEKVCFWAPSQVSLVALSGVDQASNKLNDCFPRPIGESVMAFFTHVGRAAYAVIDGDKVTWLQ